ncbi:MAG TPA: glycosyltransferase family A protein [Candidatus Saccharimonadales bacterium]|nr:glycosyltransferase family A protein [Candidatus Saccharimonadales bacterium]
MAVSETVSVIIPLYNAAPYIKETVNSILAQTFTDWRLYIIDDHSTDGSAMIAQDFAERHPAKIDYFRPEKAAGKPSVGKNVGIKRSRGELIAFMDHDDWWTPDHLERLVQLINSDPKIGLVGSNGYVVRTGQSNETETYRPIASQYGQAELRQLALAGTLFLTSSCMLVRRAVIDTFGPIDESLVAADDKELTLRVIASGRYNILAESTPTVYHRLLPSSISNRPDGIVGASRDTEIVFERYATSPNLTAEEKEAFATERTLFRKRLANYFVSVGRYSEAKMIYRAMIRSGRADRTTRLFYWLTLLLPFVARSLITQKRRWSAKLA